MNNITEMIETNKGDNNKGDNNKEDNNKEDNNKEDNNKGDNNKEDNNKGDISSDKKKISIRKKMRNYLVDKTVDIVKRSGIPLDLACLMLKIFHFRLPFDLILYASLGNVFTGLCLWIFVMGVFSFFLLLDGCVLSVIEYKLTGNCLNVMDVFLWLVGAELNYINRYNATVIAAVVYLSSFFGVVFYRCGFNGDTTLHFLIYLTILHLSNI
jgi:hypothetical protein